MGIPTSSTETFDLLQQNFILEQLTNKLKNIVHFCNTVVHNYQRTNLEIVKSVVNSELDDLVLFGDKVLEFLERKST